MEWLGHGDGTFAYNSAVSTVVDNASRVGARGDFDGDQRDDILWTSLSGATSTWLGQVDGSFIAATATYQMPTDWHVAAAGDFDGDGLFDVLWRNEGTGLTIQWLGQADGSFAYNAAADNQVDPTFHIVGIGHFNNDARADVLWRDGTGNVMSWLSDASGGSHPSGFSYAMPPDWQAQSISGFGAPDFLYIFG